MQRPLTQVYHSKFQIIRPFLDSIIIQKNYLTEVSFILKTVETWGEPSYQIYFQIQSITE